MEDSLLVEEIYTSCQVVVKADRESAERINSIKSLIAGKRTNKTCPEWFESGILKRQSNQIKSIGEVTEVEKMMVADG